MEMVITGVADIWMKPSTESERDSQLIYGEEVEVIENLGEFSKIKGRDEVTGLMKSAIIGE